MRYNSRRLLSVLLAATTTATPLSAALLPIPAQAAATPPPPASISPHGVNVIISSGSQSASSPAGQPAAGQPAPGAISPQQAADIAKKAFDIPETYSRLNSNYQEIPYPLPRKVWHLSWSSNDFLSPSINVQVDAVSGEILGMHRFTPRPPGPDGKPLLPKLSMDDARPLAEAVARKLQPQRMNDLVLMPQPKQLPPPPEAVGPFLPQVVHTIRWVRKFNNVPVSSDFRTDGITVGIDAITGQLVNYDFVWTEGPAFPPSAGAITADQALQAWLEQAPPTLEYRSFYTGRNKPQVKLVYSWAQTAAAMLDAQTGKLVARDGRALQASDLSLRPVQLPPGVAPPPPPDKPLDRDAAAARLQQMLNLPADLTLNGASLSEQEFNGGPRIPVWNLNWTRKNSDGTVPVRPFLISASIEANTGRLVNFNSDAAFAGPPAPESGDAGVTEQEALQKALDFIARTAPPVPGDELTLLPQPFPNPPGRRTFNFRHRRDGVLLPENLHLTTDSKGNVLNYFGGGPGLAAELPPKGKKISAEDLRAALQQHLELKLAYVLVSPPPEKFPAAPAPAPADMKVILAYRPYLKGYDEMFPAPAFDASTGHPLDHWGRDLTSLQTAPTDIAGHWAERQIQTVLERGLMDAPDGRFQPAKGITRAEAARLLVRAFGNSPYALERTAKVAPVFGGDVPPTHPFFQDLQQAVQRGILPASQQLRPDDPVTRLELAEMLIRALRHETVARMPVQIPHPFRDLDKAGRLEQNYAALANGLGLMTGAGRLFRPGDPVTRAEAAVVLVRAAEGPDEGR